MAVVAAFTSDVQTGARDLTVTFTDTSTGSPTNWLWNFGDGGSSNVQNPVHVYTVAGTYTVTLRAFTSSGETVTNGTSVSRLQRTGSAGSNAAAHVALLAASFGASSVQGRYDVRNLSGTYTYRQAKSTLGLDLTSFTSHIIEFRIPFSTVQGPENGIKFIESGMILPSIGAPFFTDLFVEDVTAFAGTSITRTFEPSGGGESAPTILSSPSSPNKNGWDIASAPRIYKHTFAAGNNDVETKASYITVNDPEADFSADLRKGLDDIDSTFTDLSGASTAWSWKRRPSGINAPYVEFSTAENPTENFDVTDPTP